MYALFLKEVRSFLNSLIGYITITIFLLATGLFIWVISGMENVFEIETSTLNSLFYNAPLVFMFIIPAITMRMFAEEKRTGTLELLYTKPLTDTQIILGKYLAGFFLIFLAILPTWIYYISIYNMGDPVGNIDTGGTFGGFIGLYLIGAVYVAIGTFCSAVTRNQVLSFLFSLVICFILYTGFDFIGSYNLLGAGWDAAAQSIGIRQHYATLQKGVLDVSDIIYFLGLVVTFLVLTRLVLLRGRGVTKNLIQAGIIYGIIIALNVVGHQISFRFDMTEERIHSLSDGFIDLLENDLEKPVLVTVYLSGDDFPAEVENLRRNIEDKLIEFNRLSDGVVKYQFINPSEDPKAQEAVEKQLEKAGLNQKFVREQSDSKISDILFWPGAIIQYGNDKEEAVQFIDGGMGRVHGGLLSMASNQLEFRFLQAIKKLSQKEYPKVAFLHGHGELHPDYTRSIRGHLHASYKVEDTQIKDSLGVELIYALDEYKGLIIAQPKLEFTDKEKFILDQFVMKGGKIAWLIDPLNVQEDSLYRLGQIKAEAYDLKLNDLLYNYGARLNEEIVISERCGPIYNFQNQQAAPWDFYVMGRNNTNDPVASNLNPIKMKYTGSLDPVGNDSISKRILLESSPNSKVFKNPARISLAFLQPSYRPTYSGEGVGSRTLAIMLEGDFKSFYRNSLDPAYRDNPNVKFKKRSKNGKMLVIADGDLIKNVITPKKSAGDENINPNTDILSPDIEILVQGQPYPAYANIDFFSNAFDDLMGQENLIALRGREFKQRPIDVSILGDKAKKAAIKFVNVALPLLLLLIFAVIQYLVRRSKFAKR
ncbi:MAG: ABC-2 type transport system permease protein [Parvicellaceae bacterium]|jgi:ABC-2 type transport system permease protein